MTCHVMHWWNRWIRTPCSRWAPNGIRGPCSRMSNKDRFHYISDWGHDSFFLFVIAYFESVLKHSSWFSVKIYLVAAHRPVWCFASSTPILSLSFYPSLKHTLARRGNTIIYYLIVHEFVFVLFGLAAVAMFKLFGRRSHRFSVFGKWVPWKAGHLTWRLIRHNLRMHYFVMSFCLGQKVWVTVDRAVVRHDWLIKMSHIGVLSRILGLQTIIRYVTLCSFCLQPWPTRQLSWKIISEKREFARVFQFLGTSRGWGVHVVACLCC